jgi:hypothetical protein
VEWAAAVERGEPAALPREALWGTPPPAADATTDSEEEPSHAEDR